MNIIETFNPSNVLSEKDQSAMHDLTDSQISELAQAYPNQPRGNAYLVYYMKNEKPTEQRFPLGTWKNLDSLRKLGRTDIVAHAFSKEFHASKARIEGTPVAKRVVDLSKKDIEGAEGLKKANPLNEGGGIKEVIQVKPEGFQPTELETLKSELKEAIENKAHHMTIKSLQGKIDELEGAGTEVAAKMEDPAVGNNIDLGSL